MSDFTSFDDISKSYTRFLNHLPGMAYRCKLEITPGTGEKSVDSSDRSLGEVHNTAENKNILDPEMEISYILEFVSCGCLDLLGIPAEQMLVHHWNTVERMMPPDDLQMVRLTMYDSLVAHAPYQMMYRLHLPNGVNKWVWDQGEAIYNENGEPVFVEGLVMDISDQKFQELALQEENKALRQSMSNARGLGDLVGKSEAMHRVYKLILKAAESDINVIIYGETGSGKDLVARAIHEYSAKKGPYVPVNCSAIPEQLMESEFFGHMKGSFSGAHASKEGYIGAADKGSLFLDELGELPIHLQAKLLRALENKMYTPVGGNSPRQSSFRLISATNQDLAKLVAEKKMRSDFYYRVHVLAITVPPLRERKEDIPLLVEEYCKKRKIDLKLTVNVFLAMENYDWPGNVRELMNFLDRYSAFGDSALESLGQSRASFIPEISNSLTLEDATLQLEERMIKHALEQCHWHRGNAAAKLGLNLRTMQRKMKRLGIN